MAEIKAVMTEALGTEAAIVTASLLSVCDIIAIHQYPGTLLSHEPDFIADLM
jgi:hypothetical protein